MSAPCIGPCGRDCNACQGHGRCAHCAGRPFELPTALRPLSNRAIAVCVVVLLLALWAQGCSVEACS